MSAFSGSWRKRKALVKVQQDQCRWLLSHHTGKSRHQHCWLIKTDILRSHHRKATGLVSFVETRLKKTYICFHGNWKTVSSSTPPFEALQSEDFSFGSSSEPKKSRSTFGFFFSQRKWSKPSTAPTVSLKQTLASELSSYLASPVLGSEENLLKWWQRHHVHFPTLSKVAKKKKNVHACL